MSAAAAPARKSSAPRAVRRGARGYPRLALIGGKHRTRPIGEVLRLLRLRVEHYESLPEVLAAGLDGMAAVVLIPALRDAGCERVLGAFASAHAELPVFVLVPDGAHDSRVARLYRNGATAVFEWPLEKQLFPAVLAELLGIQARSSRPTDGDRALERAVRARLRVLGKSEKRLRISVRAGVARLSGQVGRLWKVRSLESSIAQVPGVRSVDVRKLDVEPSHVSDRDIARSVRSLLHGASSIEDQTLGVSVRDGRVVLMGAVFNREECLHALELLAMVEGVRAVSNQTVAAPRRKRADRALATRLRERLATLIPEAEQIHIAVLAGVAVLRGRARLLTTKREAERLVSKEDAIARVVNKVEIGSA